MTTYVSNPLIIPYFQDDNFGFPTDQVLCRLNSDILQPPFKKNLSYIWRRPHLMKLFVSCAYQMFKDHYDHMASINGLWLRADITSEGGILVKPDTTDDVDKIRNIGI